MTVSIVITTYKRDSLLWNTLLSIKCADEIIIVDDANDTNTKNMCINLVECLRTNSSITYIPRIGRPNVEFSNPSIPINIGLKAATGNIVILQNAECKHESNVVEQFRERVKEHTVTFAKVKALNKDGEFDMWYTAPEISERPYFFCGAMFRKHFLELDGMDEEFTGPGFDDDDFAIRMQQANIRREFADDILVTHQWHERPELNSTPSLELYQRKHGSKIWA